MCSVFLCCTQARACLSMKTPCDRCFLTLAVLGQRGGEGRLFWTRFPQYRNSSSVIAPVWPNLAIPFDSACCRTSYFPPHLRRPIFSISMNLQAMREHDATHPGEPKCGAIGGTSAPAECPYAAAGSGAPL